MPDSYTSRLNLTKPEVSGSSSTWGTKLNADLDTIDSKLLKVDGDTMTGALNWATAVTVASSSTPAIFAAASNYILLSGTTTVTAFDTIAQGAVRIVRHTGIHTLTHSSNLILPGAANVVTAVGDISTWVSEGSGVTRMIGYQRAGQSPFPYDALVSTQTANNSASSLSWTGLTSGNYRLKITNLYPATTGGLQIQVGTGATPTWVTAGYYINGSYCQATTPGTNPGNTYIATFDAPYMNFTAASIRSDSTYGLNAIVDISDFLCAVGPTTMDFRGGYATNSNPTQSFVAFSGTAFVSGTTAKTAIRIICAAGYNLTAGIASLYAINT